MALVVEDGSVVAGANTYLNTGEGEVILEDRFGITGVTLTEAELKSAAQYLEGFCDQYQGVKVDPVNQSLCWPRSGVSIDCVPLSSSVIPQDLKTAQALAAYEANQGKDLQPNQSKQTVKRKSIAGQIDVEYSESGMSSGTSFTKVNQYLKPLFKTMNQQLKVFRV